MALLKRKPKLEYEVGEDGLVRMSLADHLREFRSRLMVALLAVTTCAVVAFTFYNHILRFAQAPYCRIQADRGMADKCGFFVRDALQGITTRFTVSAYVGLIFAFPVVAYELWMFITPGLHKHEKRYAVPFVISSALLFALGCVIAYYTWDQALGFLLGIAGENVETLMEPGAYMGLFAGVTVAFGISFEFPVVLVFLQIARILKPKQLLGFWRYAIVIIFIFAAVITPSQDPYSLLGMAVPMCIFYFGAAGIGHFIIKRRDTKKAEQEAAENASFNSPSQ